MKDNPYSLVFGKEPKQFIARLPQSNEVVSSFMSEEPSQQIYIITGVRGSGKTVLMTEIAKQISKDKDWIVIELNPERDMLTALASKLSSENTLAAIFQEARINLSFFGFGAEIAGAKPINDIEVALSKMLDSLKRKGKKVLINIDEVSNTENMRIFSAAFQILIRQDLPLFLLMTGLYENINNLQNEKSLTFLYRAPKIELKPLNLNTIARNYMKTLKVSNEEAVYMAKLTKGYSFAFQVLGYFTYKSGGLTDEAIESYQDYLYDYVYDKLWDELSPNDRKTAYSIAITKTGKIREIRDYLQIDTNHFNPYRKRLIQKGLVDGDQRGYLHFVLPYFESYVKDAYESQI